ncbi:MAG: hypothetical protein AUK63_511 [bacterium P3]|nr:MAG: hypothetical protein AUK63_511 [bacterium P3]KWW41967.1 MAG: hypothetical protein F083_618 [bacterium F083]
MNRQKTFNTFRQTYPSFVYDSYHYDVRPDGLHIVFSFRVMDREGRHPVVFSPSAFVPARRFLDFRQSAATLDALVFHIGMAELVSYWKCFCPPAVEVRCGSLDAVQIAFWKRLYFLGLGEFFYTNGIVVSEADFMTIASNGSTHMLPLADAGDRTACLLPIGGGKDSVVSLELLRGAGVGVTPLILNPRGATLSCAAAAGFGVDDTLVLQRSLDPLMLKLNGQGCLNGHTPFSALLAFYSLLAAQLSGVHAIALSNENSANESTVAGTEVNHQYSKSWMFERDFRRYVASYLGGGYDYFSLLRPLCELQIAMLFARTERYFDIFRSCNVGSKQDVWCGRCAKCLFAFIILSPFIAPGRLASIFGRNMLDDADMLPLLRQLTGRAETKPFECVGTVDEVLAALALTRRRWYDGGTLPALIAAAAPLPSWQDAARLIAPMAEEHFLDTGLLGHLACRLEEARKEYMMHF